MNQNELERLIARCKEEIDSLPGRYDRHPRVGNELHPAVAPEKLEQLLSGSPSHLARVIDHTLLKPEATPDDVKALCRVAREQNFFSVCVNSIYVPLAAEELVGSGVELAAVVGFPLGAAPVEVKYAETEYAVAHGATEIDMVIPVGLLRSGAYADVHDHISSVVHAAGDALVKVIIETCLLTQEEKVKACLIALKADAEFVKTSTGFSTGGATVDDITLMRAVVGRCAGVKASGGVRTTQDARAMVKAGANRIGASASVAIVGK